MCTCAIIKTTKREINKEKKIFLGLSEQLSKKSFYLCAEMQQKCISEMKISNLLNHTKMNKRDLFLVRIYTRSYYDKENGNPYYAFRVVLFLRPYAYNVTLECSADWGTCSEEGIRTNWVYPAIYRTLGIQLSDRDLMTESNPEGVVVHMSHLKCRSIKSLESPKDWTECE